MSHKATLRDLRHRNPTTAQLDRGRSYPRRHL